MVHYHHRIDPFLAIYSNSGLRSHRFLLQVRASYACVLMFYNIVSWVQETIDAECFALNSQ